MVYHGVSGSMPLLALLQPGCSVGTMAYNGVPPRLQYRLQYSQKPDQPIMTPRKPGSWRPDSCHHSIRRRRAFPTPSPRYPRGRYSTRSAQSSGSFTVAISSKSLMHCPIVTLS